MDRPPPPRALAAGRLVGVAVTVLGLGSGAHVLGGGAAPTLPALLLAGVPVLLGATALSRRPLTVPVLLPAALAGQLGVHAALTWLAGPARPGAAAASGLPSGHHAGAVAPVGALADVPHTHGAGAGMVGAHALAVVVAVLLLVATDRGVGALLRRWSAVLPALLGGRVAVPARRPAPVRSRVAVPRPPAVLRGGAARRGPPVPVPAAAAA
ncbi:hypothetical protein [Cellulomonas sp. C5510]|uniref:hypothetical protein n=1 Tax=Cellulomonas sp. C5510 TaxID=2871170 RepID=UPI001C940AEC|nr:hypothetical protein [Cellulomonas sp. C5510]QZN86471.1 hypothetical protein K5O09_04770 [Cellulomonas sp. C5510]